ncbi:transposase [Plantactinospora sp. KLBMP9567]|uniref:IS701 family transposase n=1 Tax=Plantactinospora sp. KLBMP9567 TaxID=3085900 RepID=UPI00298129ED|nr:transposase [Plantactinospora sp. KLBMP9567]MDW5330245.1 transposase [Plantactinospora sp. KLBMP9567]
MDEARLAQLRRQLEGFAAEVFAGLPRVDQRETGVRYLRGLMLDGRRKSMQPMAARLGVDHQQLQQFLTSSTWDVTGVRRRLATTAVEVVTPRVWVVDDTGFVKDGPASACVARQYSGTLGKVGNCQIAVSVHAATDVASAVLDWRLFVPESWDETCVPDEAGKVVNGHARRLRRQPVTLDEAGRKKPHARKEVPREEQVTQIVRRRTASKIPDDQRYRPKWLMALEMIDELADWNLRPPLLTADAGYGQVAEFRQGLTDRGITYIVATTSSTTAQRGHAEPVDVAYAGVGKHPVPRYPHPARSVKDLALDHGAHHATLVHWRERLATADSTSDRPTGTLSGYFFALRIRPAGRTVRRGTPQQEDGVLPDCWLLVQWPPGHDEPTDYWLSDLPADTSLTDLVHLAKSRWRIEHDYRELETGLGLDHFEGRSWIGWHRHVTLATAAQLFLTQLRLTHPKAAGQS